MKLKEFEKYFKSRAECAKAFKVKSQQIATWVCQDRDVIPLTNGCWMIINKFSVISKKLDIKVVGNIHQHTHLLDIEEKE